MNQEASSTDYSSSGIKIHILLIGLVFVVLNGYWTLMGSEVWHSTQLTIASLFFNAVFTLLVLVIINLVIKKIVPRFAMSQADMLTIYVMVVMLTTISGHTMMGYLLPAIAHAFWFATPENEWLQLFGSHVPDWMAVKDADVLRGFYEGESSLYITRNLKAWFKPVLAWSSFVIVLWIVLLSMNIFIRKQWTENERLSYPIIQLPVAMTGNPRKFFGNRLMWIGFSISGTICILNGLSYINPAVPYINVKHQGIASFTSRPWNAMGTLTISFYPFIIGLMFFTPLDLSFSCWFFYVFGRIQRIVGIGMIGAKSIYFYEQSIGAWIAFGLIPLWMGRKFYIRIINRIFRRNYPLDDSSEPMSYRTATIILVIGSLYLFLFLNHAGMSFWAIGIFSMIYAPMVLGITRSRAEIGPPLHTLIYVDPARTMVTTMGTYRLGTPNLTILTYLYPLNRCFRANPMPSELEALRIAERTRIGYRQILAGMILAIVFGIFITFWLYLHVMYDLGATSKARGWIGTMGWEFFNRLNNWLVYPQNTNWSETGGIIGGFIFTIFLAIMKGRFLWWPFHPGGYVLTTGGGLGRSWFAVFISWMLKAIILRAGGVRLYRRAVPFFFGLMLGDYALGCVWSLIGIAFKIPTYGVWH
ncbi:hypothetical protein GF312_19505 [Candidatus Poribacteria bacterium]|nr:hypothetical protein [Candidatus Poribacteria bacterium]